jgi:hypothetical protein
MMHPQHIADMIKQLARPAAVARKIAFLPSVSSLFSPEEPPNNTAAIREYVKGALEGTIKLHTTKSTTVYYEIDGEIVEDWDA